MVDVNSYRKDYKKTISKLGNAKNIIFGYREDGLFCKC